MKIFIKILLATLLAQISAGALASGPAESGAKALKPLQAEDFKAKPAAKDKQVSSVRGHLNLKPVTAEEFKAGPSKDSRHSPGIRDHLNLKPVTADEFKQVAGTPRQ